MKIFKPMHEVIVIDKLPVIVILPAKMTKAVEKK
jgi:hypothetical protein